MVSNCEILRSFYELDHSKKVFGLNKDSTGNQANLTGKIEEEDARDSDHHGIHRKCVVGLDSTDLPRNVSSIKGMASSRAKRSTKRKSILLHPIAERDISLHDSR